MILDCNVQESKTKSAQLAQQDAELAAAKRELATCLAAHEKSERVRPTPYVHILRGQRPVTHVHILLCKTLGLITQGMR